MIQCLPDLTHRHHHNKTHFAQDVRVVRIIAVLLSLCGYSGELYRGLSGPQNDVKDTLHLNLSLLVKATQQKEYLSTNPFRSVL